MKKKSKKTPGKSVGKETYIVQIYRKGKKSGETLVGTIEEIKSGEKGAFKAGKELLDWISRNEKNA